MSHGKGNHVKTRIPSSTYTFKWSVENFSKFLADKTLTSSRFYPTSSGREWYSTLEKSSSSVTWKMVNSDRESVHVTHSMSIVDSRGGILFKKSREKTYDYHNNTCSIFQFSDQEMVTKLEEDGNDLVTFVCFMTLTGDNTTTENFDIQPHVVDPTENFKKLSNDLKTMYGVSLYTDVCLRVGDTVLRAHKAIVCARSPVFAKMFEHKMNEQETNTIEITDLDVDALKDLVSYLYTGVVPDEGMESLLALYYAADKYDVSALRKTCGDMLLTKLDVDSACSIFTLADRHSDDSLKKSVLTFMDIYLEAILGTEGWTDMVNNETKLAADVMNLRATKKKKQDESLTIENDEQTDEYQYHLRGVNDPFLG